jgi:iron-sulfur cluster assembly protein
MIILTERAAKRVQQQIKERGRGIGIMLGVMPNGCTGLSYKLEYVDELPQHGEWMTYNSHDVIVVVKQQDLPFIDGLKMEWKREGLNQGFEFINPNESSKCGCGKSFTV